MSMAATIEVEELFVERGTAALRGVSLAVAEGESVAVVGDDQPSLSLLVRCCGGLLRPDRGRVRVAGVDVAAADRYALLDLRRTVGYVSTHGGLLANMSLRANVELPLRYHGRLPASTIAERAARLLDDAGLTARADERASTQPADIQKVVAYLRVVATEPRVLLVEDPSALLHPRGRALVRQLHQGLRERGVTVLVTDDDDAFAAELTSRQILVQPAQEGAP